jgi:CubicO group peptidase (beta-lactamase class C family)
MSEPKVTTAEELGLMQGSPPGDDRLVTLDNWQSGPWNRWSYQHVGQIIPCSRIWCGDDRPALLESDPQDVGRVEFAATDGAPMTVAELVERTYSDGLLVLHGGQVVTEQYFNGMAPQARHLLQSVSKSLTGALAGVLVARGRLEPEQGVCQYVPELVGAFDGATVRQVLDMTTGTCFSEDYDDPASDIRMYEGAAGWRPAPDDTPGLFEYITTLGNCRPHGAVFEYRSILTDLLGWIIERAGGRPFAELMSELLWRPLGAQWDAEITVDRCGSPMTDGGISVTLRDLARFGQMYVRRGVAGGREVLPAAFVDDTRYGDSVCREAFARSDKAARYPRGHYRNQWWVPDPQRGVLLGAGIYGQYLYVDMTADVVIAKVSTLPFALDLDVSADHVRAFAAITEALAG